MLSTVQFAPGPWCKDGWRTFQASGSYGTVKCSCGISFVLKTDVDPVLALFCLFISAAGMNLQSARYSHQLISLTVSKS